MARRRGGQPGFYAVNAADIASCPAPRALEAVAIDSVTVEITFDRRIDAASAELGDFSIAGSPSRPRRRRTARSP